MTRKHHKPDAWKKSIHLVTEIYRLTDTHPKRELYGLTS